MSFISCYGSQSYRAIPLPADQIITEQITFSDGSAQTSGYIPLAQPGAYMLSNADFNEAILFPPCPIYWSCDDLQMYGITINTNLPNAASSVDCGWIVAPNYKLVLYDGIEYPDDNKTIELINNGSTPKLFTCYSEPEEGIYAPIYSGGIDGITYATKTPSEYLYNWTKSLKLYHKNADGSYTECTQTGIS